MMIPYNPALMDVLHSINERNEDNPISNLDIPLLSNNTTSETTYSGAATTGAAASESSGTME